MCKYWGREGDRYEELRCDTLSGCHFSANWRYARLISLSDADRGMPSTLYGSSWNAWDTATSAVAVRSTRKNKSASFFAVVRPRMFQIAKLVMT